MNSNLDAEFVDREGPLYTTLAAGLKFHSHEILLGDRGPNTIQRNLLHKIVSSIKWDNELCMPS